MTMVVNGTLDEEITGGNMTLSLKYGIIPLINSKTFDTCSLPLDCPLPQGPASINRTFEIPHGIPAGTYKWTLKMMDQKDEEVMCVQLKLDMELPPPHRTAAGEGEGGVVLQGEH
eukprot:TRINITY_DN2275_c0_g1_i2.p1 TRINITY_DN2275_c0_g1~~TRINITY_DN2275_c0_g1_i2.p1  ORF type:complete len:115 (+),score=39.35 TRINITY_DN2275_c0_g1_i2:153-497(+)